MSFQFEFKAFQIALLELQAVKMDPSSVHIPGYVRRGGWAPAYVERERVKRTRKRELLLRRIEYLKRRHYIEYVDDKKKRLYQLTTKGQYEIIRLEFILHMQAQRKKRWDGNFYLIIFDIQEAMKKYRDFIRKLLKQNGFTMIQLSVWMTKYNPEPALGALLRYLEVERYFEIMKISCTECSPRLRRRVRRSRG